MISFTPPSRIWQIVFPHQQFSIGRPEFFYLSLFLSPQTSDPSRRFIYYIIGPNIKKLFKDRYTARYHGLEGLIPFGERSVLFDARLLYITSRTITQVLVDIQFSL